ncbi:FANCA isoform 4 [Pan troglodytes]|uniref:FANCA isoform 4 n=1 Tax=Pan troglodytes TaxID=9598 RepID=A0A2J8J060_PANTR|nr:FANCA isoform 4 [Pan troglodytes]
MSDSWVPNSASGQDPGRRRRSWAELLGRWAGGRGSGRRPARDGFAGSPIPSRPSLRRSDPRTPRPGACAGWAPGWGGAAASDPAPTRPLLRLGGRPQPPPAGRSLLSRTPPPPAALSGGPGLRGLGLPSAQRPPLASRPRAPLPRALLGRLPRRPRWGRFR